MMQDLKWDSLERCSELSCLLLFKAMHQETAIPFQATFFIQSTTPVATVNNVFRSGQNSGIC